MKYLTAWILVDGNVNWGYFEDPVESSQEGVKIAFAMRRCDSQRETLEALVSILKQDGIQWLAPRVEPIQSPSTEWILDLSTLRTEFEQLKAHD